MAAHSRSESRGLRSLLPGHRHPDRGPLPRLILHIGAGKSGSSAIQLALAENASVLRERGVLVPDVRLGIGAAVTGRQVAFFEGLLPVDEERARTVRQRLEVLRQRADERHCTSVVISAENLINTRQFARLFASAHELFDVSVVAYVRRQDDFLVAAWNQWAFKVHDDFDSWLASVKGRLGDWDGLIRAWEEEVPAARVEVRVFQRDRLVHNDVVADFFEAIGIPTDGLQIRQTDVNRGLNELAMRIAMRERELFENAHDTRFTDFLARLGGDLVTEPINTGLYLHPEARRAIVLAYAESNEALRKRHLPELPPGELFSSDFSDTRLPVDATGLLERELRLVWRALFRLAGPGRDSRRAASGPIDPSALGQDGP